ncbi:MAG: PA0069 family radical SAM protein [Rhodobacteraceae bacterium]|nr:PA0069 family radical SAM protein [Paracoccaceae bacterium]
MFLFALMQDETEDKGAAIEAERRRGRGAISNQAGRFDLGREECSDGWDIPELRAGFRTDLRLEVARTILTRNASPDVPFDRSINPYRGCEHGCVYCFARPSHAWLGLSPGLDFETKLIGRPNAAAVLARTLRRRGYDVAPIAIGTNTDAYQPVERDQEIMRDILKVLRDFRHPVAIVTKGSLIERDIDILSEMAAQGLVHVGVSVTTLDAGIARAMEPRVPVPKRRLATIRALSEAGVPVRVMMAPVVPGLTDTEIEAVFAAAREAGAVAASWIMLRLPREVAGLFEEWLGEAFPGRAARIMARVREMHGGKAYDPAFGKRMRGEGAYADMIAARARLAMQTHGLVRRLPALVCDRFEVPLGSSDQPALF